MPGTHDKAVPRWQAARKAVSLSLPLTAFFLVQNAVSLASLAMIGRLGNLALAGTGVAGVVYTILLALLFGFDTAVQALVSRATGAGDDPLAGRILSDALSLSIPFGIFVCAIAALSVHGVIHILAPNHGAAVAGEQFFFYSIPSLAFLSVTIPINAYWIGSGRPAIALRVTFLIAPAQIILTWLLVFGLGELRGLGLAGAGAALSVSTLIGLFLQAALVLRTPAKAELFRKWPTPERARNIIGIGWPVSLQQSLLQFGLMISFAIVSQLGVTSVVILNVLSNLMTVPIQIATGLGIASATLVGQAIGRGDMFDAKQWGWRLATAGAAILLPFGLLAALAPHMLLGFFIADPTTLSKAIWPARLLGWAIAFDAFGRVLGFALRGAGATKSATSIAFVLQWLVQLPLMWWVGLKLGQGFNGIVAVQFAIIAVSFVAFSLAWNAGRWSTIKLSIAPQSPKFARERAGACLSEV